LIFSLSPRKGNDEKESETGLENGLQSKTQQKTVDPALPNLNERCAFTWTMPINLLLQLRVEQSKSVLGCMNES
jgi:hypothetical protein